jgi:hypothetical protein
MESLMNAIQEYSALITECPFIPDEYISTCAPFIEADAIESSLDEIHEKHLIPVYVNDNEPVISHADFIDATYSCFRGHHFEQKILNTRVRLSHPIKGRVPEAKNKATNELLEHEKTLYYERMAFVIEAPTLCFEVGGKELHLVAGGVRTYNHDDLRSRRVYEHFKVFIGFQVKGGTNLCVCPDTYLSDLQVASIYDLHRCIDEFIGKYNYIPHLHHLEQLCEYSLTEAQFTHVIGKCKMYPYVPKQVQSVVSPLLFDERQLGMVCRDYYRDRDNDGNINLWQLYNLLAGANKCSSIDTFLDKSVNAFQFVEQLSFALENKQSNWFLNCPVQSFS